MKRFAFLLLFILATPALAQSWPSRPVRIVVPFPPGGNTDSMARITAERLTQRLANPVVVENRTGGGGAIAADLVAKSPPDGYTLFFATLPQMAILPALTKTPYDPVKDFAPVSIVGRNMFALAVHPSVPAKDLKEFIAYIRERPGKVSYASAGNGSVSHLSVALLLQRAGLEMVHVPYKGGPPAIADTMAGHTALYFGNLTEILPPARGGKVKVIAVSGARRSAQFPEVGTVAEQGFPGYRTETWNGVSAPAGTPAAVIKRLADEIGAAAKDPAFISRLGAIGIEAVGNTPAEFAAVLEADLKIWAEAVKVSGAKLE